MADEIAPVDRVGTLLAAGFAPDEVSAWSTQQRATLGAAGFAEPEIDEYLGGAAKPVPEAFMDRLRRADERNSLFNFVRSLPEFGRGFAKGVALPGEALKEQLPAMPGVEQAGAAIGRIPGGFVDALRQAGQTTEAAMTGQPISPEEVASAAMFGAHFSRFSSPTISRIARTPMGEVHEQQIGGLPKPTDFANATTAITGTPEPAPQAYGKLDRLWQEQGLHPAEVAADAAKDVTITQDLAATGNELPRSYLEADRVAPATVPPEAPVVAQGVTAPPAAPLVDDPLALQRRGELTAARAGEIRDEVSGTKLGEGAPEHLDPEIWKVIADNLGKAEASREGGVSVVADQMRYLPDDGVPKTISEREAVAVIARALDAEAARGGDIGSFLADADAAYRAADGGTPPDVSAAEAARAAPTARAAPGAAPAPTTTPRAPAPPEGISAASETGAITEPPPQLRSYAPSDLRVDAQRFQFKEGGDTSGVSDRLQGVTQWDPIKSGLGIVYEDANGASYIVDGHQRLALAQRIETADPAQQPRLNAWTLRAADGITDADARAAAAAKNIAEGTGTAVDAAKVLRDRPDLVDGLPPRSELVRQARGLLNLDPEAFGKIVNDVVPAAYGSIVGRLAPADAAMQNALVDLLAKTHPENMVQAESVVRQGIDAGLHRETQATLFGDQEMVSSLYAERARILDRALKQLRRDRTVFQSIVDNNTIIEDLGNRLAQDANLRRATIDGHAAQILQTLANRRGPLSDALTGSARAVGDGSRDVAAATRDFVAEIRRQAESGDLARGADGGGGGAVATAGEGAAATERAGAAVAPEAEARAADQVEAAIREPTAEPTAQGSQLVIPGAEQSAVQAAAGREAAGHGRIAPTVSQAEPGGLFAQPAEPPQPGLFERLAKSEEGTLRMGKAEPPRDPAEHAILSRLSIGESDAGRPWSWSRIYAAIVDRLNPLAKTVKEAAPGEKLPTGDDPYQLARLFAGVSGKAEHWIEHGTFDFKTYQATGKSLKEILAPVSDDLDGFRAFATSLRALELEGRGIKTGMDLDAARTVARAGADRYAPIMAELVDYQNKLAVYLKDAGILSETGLGEMRAANPLYVPFQRVFGDVLGDIVPDVVRGPGASMQASNPIHAIKGSERLVIDPLESIVRNTYLSLAAAEKNAVGTKLIDLLQRAGDMPVPARSDTISIFRNGIKETHTVSAELAAAMKGLDEEAANTMLRLLSVPARMLRAGATLSPDFMLRNPVRDFFSAVINTAKGAFSPLDSAKGLLSAISKDAHFQEWLKGGGANAVMVSLDRRYLQQSLAQITADTGLAARSWNVVRHPIDTLRIVSQLTEEATRIGEFRGVRQQQLAAGATEKEATQAAAYAAREVSIDFARRGAMTRSMNMITAFWNAQVQGLDRIGRAFKDNPVGTSLKVAAGITLPSILLWWANHDDPRWKEIPDWERDLFWIVMTKNHIFRIPKPFEPGVIFGSGVERLLDAYVDQKPEAFHDFSKSILSALLPGGIPTFALPFIEQWANRSSFTDRPLIPQSMEKHLPEYQYTPNTTETAKALGQIVGAFPGIKDAKLGDGVGGGVARALSTPILLENYVRGWSGGLGSYAVQLADAALRKSGVLPDPVKPSDTLADIPVVKAFVVRYPSAGTESIQQFYDEYTKNKVYFDTWMAKAGEGDAAALTHIQEMGGPRMFVQFDAIKAAMGEHSTLVRDIYKNPQMSAGDKRQLIDQLYYGEMQIAQQGLAAMRQVDAALAPR